jgi:hypothetical protein
MTAIRLPVGAGSLGISIVPDFRSKSATNRSRRPIATGSHFFPRMQSFSHWSSCGQTLPQTAGRQFVSLIFRAAPRKSPSATSWTKPGMSKSTGHPDTEPGFLHWMQRLASSMAVSGE